MSAILHRPKMLDLCAGLGGSSSAFFARGWDVTRIDNNPDLAKVPGMVIADIFEDHWAFEQEWNFIWASVDCRDFTLGFHGRRATAQREGKEFIPDLEPLKRVLEIIEKVKPRYWIIENVAGASRIFTEVIGKPPRQIIGPYFLWGQFPYISMPDDWVPEKKQNVAPGPNRYQIRSKIPFELSQAVRCAIEQPTLEDFL